MHHHIWASQQMRKCRCKAMQMHCKKCVGLSECCNHHGRVTLGSAPSGIWTPCSSACSHGAQIHGAWPLRWRREATMGDQRNLEKCCRTAWGPRYVNEAPSGMRGWAKWWARASSVTGLNALGNTCCGEVRSCPNVASPQHFSSNAC